MQKKHPPQNSPDVPAEERILAAATDEFAAKGFFGARTQTIADAAGINKAMLHYYFRSKENLYREVIRAAFSKIFAQVRLTWLGEGPLGDRVEGVVDSYIDNYTHNPGILKIVMREVVDGGERFRRIFKESKLIDFVGLGHTYQDLLESVGEELGIDNEEAMHMVINLVGMCLISFISPLILETIVGLDLSDFNRFIEQRRTAVKSMARAYLDSRAEMLEKRTQ